MPKYIDAERLKFCFHQNVVCGDAFDTIIDMQPAADVRENIHGQWIEDDYAFNHCSECGYELDYPEEKTPFCPGCGANMEPDPEDATKWEQSMLGRRISEMLEKKGITQREFAEMVGVTEVAMSRFIKGSHIPPTVLLKINRHLFPAANNRDCKMVASGCKMSRRDVSSSLSDLSPTTTEKMTMKRAAILDAAKQIVTQDREDQYGKPENSFETIASLWAGYLQGCGVKLDFLEAHDVAAMMALLKIARIATGSSKEDNWIDLAGYAACGGELQQPKWTTE